MQKNIICKKEYLYDNSYIGFYFKIMIGGFINEDYLFIKNKKYKIVADTDIFIVQTPKGAVIFETKDYNHGEGYPKMEEYFYSEKELREAKLNKLI